MKFHRMPLAILMATALGAFAQVEVEVVLDQDKFLPAEQLMAGVRIVNRSGQTLTLGEDADWAHFSIERLDGGGVHQISQPPVQGAFTLQSSERATVKVDLAPHYELRKQGRYSMTAQVKIKDWNRIINSRPVTLEIVEGTKLWEQPFGVPQAAGSSQPPEVRKYALQEANYLKSQLRLYLRVTSGDGMVIKLLNLGPMIGFDRPEPQVDAQSRLHVLFQNAAKNFAYYVVSPDGEVLVRQNYEYTETRPRLRLDDSGRIVVSGGSRRTTAEDLPAVVKAKDDVKELKP